MGFFKGGFDKVYRVKLFADQSALHINKTNENGVNVTKSKENVPDEKNTQWVEIIFEGASTVIY